MAKTKGNKKKNRMPARKRTAGGYTRTAVRIPEGITEFQVKDDKTRRVDIIPFKAGKGNPYADEGTMHYERTFWVHRGIGAEKDTYVCPLKTFKKPCPVCEFRRELDSDPDADEKLVKDLLPKERQLWNLIDTADREKGIQLWDVSYHLFGKHLEARTDDVDEEDEHYTYFAEFDEGSTLRVGFEEKSFGTIKYYEASSIDFKERKQQYTEDIVEQAKCPADLLIEVAYDKLKAIFLQSDTPEGGDEDEDEKPAKKKGKKKKDKTKAKDTEDCVACEGSGKSSKGKTCKPCGGSGSKNEDADEIPLPVEPEPEPEDEPEDDKPAKGKKKKKKKDKQKCPGGGKFGKDLDTLEDCDDCELWDACDDKKNG